MLTDLHIRDFAIVDRLQLELGAGLTAITGETGAGKSIMVDALSLALGERAGASVIRHGSERAEITACFDVSNRQDAREWLERAGLDDGDQCILRRQINRSSASRAFINGQPCPVQQLRELGDLLVDIHGQHEHQSLMRRDAQRRLLDDFANHEPLVEAVRAACERWRALHGEVAELTSRRAQRDDRLELLRYQVSELRTLKLQAGEYAELEQEHARLANAHRLLATAQAAVDHLDEAEDNAINQALARTLSSLRDLTDIDPRLAPACELIDSALIQLNEAGSELRRYADSVDLDPERLDWVDERLGALHEQARKHGVSPQQLLDHQSDLEQELAHLETNELRLGELEQALRQVRDDYDAAARALSESRHAAATRLAAEVSAYMEQLGMAQGVFDVSFEATPGETPGPNGAERVEFRVSANPGQAPQPLTRVASGGELSRISLAIQVICAQQVRIPTLVFDEVDVGVGGAVAERVGQLLRALATQRQVLCVTHLPQVASLGHNQLQVSKHTAGGQTLIRVQALDHAMRVEEIARMLGGLEISATTLSHAREMLERASGVPKTKPQPGAKTRRAKKRA